MNLSLLYSDDIVFFNFDFVSVNIAERFLFKSVEEKYGGLSRRSSHIRDRHECLSLLAKEYGDLHDYLPECTLVISDITDL